ncbi:ribbon-helix-helix domain-containing protein [Hyperthermus butylicus]|uniref:Transcriptional regulator n=1 Tax=Hyperthermus butylicus (strain DSM 5456 / JCM 9403 / PLM1-5) TaxID=415426 RepID=A2BJ34_HYPBU|nr:ribbon-helix-helix domain-containing protein [Hyperthermus butylicus]ABM79995.1 transcriptional regulator [Hyperthermus butylicus DSM 5456]
MRLVTVKMPETYLEGLDELVKMGRYSSRSEAIRIAVRELLKRELWGIPEHPTGLELSRQPRRITV